MATRIIAVLNQKGGVGKTTTCVNLGAALARRGFRVLLVDMDPQANLTVHLGLEPQRLPHTTYSLLIGQHGLADAVHATGVPGLFAVPSTLALANAEIQLASTVGRELVLREALEDWFESGDPEATTAGADGAPGSLGGSGEGGSAESESGTAIRPGADFVLIDCPPSLGTLTMNALCAAGEVLLPIQTEFFALQGVAGILESVRAVQRLNKGLRLSLVVPSLVDRRTTLARDVIDEVRTYFGDVVTHTEIRKNVKLAEAPSHGKTIFEWDPRCNGAKDYDSLAAEVLGESLPGADEPASVETADDQPQGRAEETDSGEPESGGPVSGAPEPEPATPEEATPEEATPEEGPGAGTAAETPPSVVVASVVAAAVVAEVGEPSTELADDVPVLEDPISDPLPTPLSESGSEPLDGSSDAAQTTDHDAETPTRSSGIALPATVDPSQVPHLNAPLRGHDPREQSNEGHAYEGQAYEGHAYEGHAYEGHAYEGQGPAAPELLPPPASRFGTERAAPTTATSTWATSSDTSAGAERLPAVAEPSSEEPAPTPAPAAPVDERAVNEAPENRAVQDETVQDETVQDETGHDETGHDETGHDETGHDETGHDETLAREAAARQAAGARTSWWRSLRRNTLGE